MLDFMDFTANISTDYKIKNEVANFCVDWLGNNLIITYKLSLFFMLCYSFYS